MEFQNIDFETWERKEYFNHYHNKVPCTYSITVNVDITALYNFTKRDKFKLYPSLIYCISNIVNKHKEFRTSFDKDGRLGFYDVLFPCYTIFNKSTDTFSGIWTEYCEDYREFHRLYLADLSNYRNSTKMFPKPVPDNTFNISAIPWIDFTSFNLNLEKGFLYLLPIFTIGKYNWQNTRLIVPLSIQVHHSVCDGFHVSRFVIELQSLLNHFGMATESETLL